MKLRLLLFKECNRNCDGCCNNDWDLDALPVCEDYEPYSVIMLTGGEPMLRSDIVVDTIRDIRAGSKAKIYIYTAMVHDKISDGPYIARNVLLMVDGMTVTLHDQADVEPWRRFAEIITDIAPTKALRVNVFDDIDLHGFKPENWDIRRKVWIKDSPLPDNEVFMRLR